MKIRSLFSAKFLLHCLLAATLLIALWHPTLAHAGNFWSPNASATASAVTCSSAASGTPGTTTAASNLSGGWACDSSVKFMSAIFGNIVLSIASGTITPDNPTPMLATLLGTLNSAMLVMGMAMMSYNFIGAAVQTAKDGEWMGKKWDTTLVPLRTAGGFAMLLPTGAGYSFLQVILIWTGLQAVGLAGTLWQASIGYFQTQTMLAAPYITTNKTAEQIFLMSTCLQAAPTFGWQVTNTGDQIGSAPAVPPTSQGGGGTSGSTSNGFITLSVPAYESMTSSGLCGTISWSQTPMWKSAYSTVASVFSGANGTPANSATAPSSNPLFALMSNQPQIVTSASAAPFSSFNLDSAPDQIELMSQTAAKDFEAQVRAYHGIVINNMLNGTDTSICTGAAAASGSATANSPLSTVPGDTSAQATAFANLKAYAGAMFAGNDASKSSFMPGNTINGVASQPGAYYNAISIAQAKYETELTCGINQALQSTLYNSQEECADSSNFYTGSNTSTNGCGTGSTNTTSSTSTTPWYLQKMINQMQTSGWIHAGSFYMKIAHLNNAIQTKINQSISTMYTMPNMEAMGNPSQNALFHAYLINVKESLNGGHELSKTVDNSVGNEGVMHRAWHRITGAFTDSFLNFALVGKIGNSGLDPLVQMKNIGDTILVTAETATILGSETLTNALGGSKGDSSSGSSSGGGLLSTIVSMLIGVMFLMGMYLSIMLPMMPYMFWVSGVIFWFITFIEAIVAAPLWAIAHMHPEGGDLTGKGTPGYMFWFYILTKPALMVVFLYAAMILIKPAMVFVNGGFFEAISNMTEGSMAGIATMLGTIIMYSALSTNMVMKCFGMINTGPDHVYRWIGGGDSVGSEANQHANAVHGQARGSAQQAISNNSIGRVLGALGGKGKSVVGGGASGF